MSSRQRYKLSFFDNTFSPFLLGTRFFKGVGDNREANEPNNSFVSKRLFSVDEGDKIMMFDD